MEHSNSNANLQDLDVDDDQNQNRLSVSSRSSRSSLGESPLPPPLPSSSSSGGGGGMTPIGASSSYIKPPNEPYPSQPYPSEGSPNQPALPEEREGEGEGEREGLREGNPEEVKRKPVQTSPSNIEAGGLPSYRQAVDAPPPTYDSVFSSIRRERENASSTSGFLMNACKILCFAFGILILIGLVFSVSISMIVMGALYWDAECSTNKLKIYLIVGGVVGIVSNFTSFGSRKKKKRNSNGEETEEAANPLLSCCNSLLSTFSSIWFALGCYWVYTYDPGVNYEFCDRTLYLFTFWIITSTFILIGAICVLVCCGVCCVLAFVK